MASLIYKSVGNKEEPPLSLKWKAVQTECIVTMAPNTLPKQQISNGSDDTQVHVGTNDTVSDHIDIEKENSNDCRISSRSRKIPYTRKKDFYG